MTITEEQKSALITLVQVVCTLRQNNLRELEEILNEIDCADDDFNAALLAVNADFISEGEKIDPSLLLDIE